MKSNELIKRFSENIYSVKGDHGKLEEAVEDALKNKEYSLVQEMIKKQLPKMMLDNYYSRAARRIFESIGNYGDKSFMPFIANLDLKEIWINERFGLEQWIIIAFGKIANRNKKSKEELKEASRGSYKTITIYAKRYLK